MPYRGRSMTISYQKSAKLKSAKNKGRLGTSSPSLPPFLFCLPLFLRLFLLSSLLLVHLFIYLFIYLNLFIFFFTYIRIYLFSCLSFFPSFNLFLFLRFFTTTLTDLFTSSTILVSSCLPLFLFLRKPGVTAKHYFASPSFQKNIYRLSISFQLMKYQKFGKMKNKMVKISRI